MSTSLSNIQQTLASHAITVTIQTTANGAELVLPEGGTSLTALGTAAETLLPSVISQELDGSFLSYGSNLLKLDDAYLTEANTYTPTSTGGDPSPPTTLTLNLKWESAKWILIQNILTVENPEIKAHITTSGEAKTTAVTISGTLTFGGVPLNVSVVVPDMVVTGALAGTVPVGGYPLAPFFKIFGFKSSLLNDISLTDFRFSASALSHIFSLDLAVDTTLSIPLPGSNSFEPDNIGIQVQHIGGTPSDTDVTIRGQVTIDSDIFYLSVGHDTIGGLNINGQATFATPILLTTIANSLLTKFGFTSDDIPLPSGFANLSLASLSFSYDSSTEAFSFDVELTEAISVSTLSDSKINTGSSPQSCVSFQINSTKTDGVRSTKLSLTIPTGLYFTDLLDLKGDLPASLNYELDEIDIEADTSPTNHKLSVSTTFSDTSGGQFIFTGVHDSEVSGDTTTTSFGGSIYSPGGAGLNLQPTVPIDINIKDLFITKIKIETTGQPTEYYTIYGSDLSAHIDINLGTLPVVGGFLEEAKLDFSGLRFVYAKSNTITSPSTTKVASTKPITSKNLGFINSFLAEIDVAALTTSGSSTANANQSSEGFPVGFSLQGMLILGDNLEKIPLHTGFPPSSESSGNPAPGTASTLTPSTASSPSTPTPVGKKFGPVTIKNASLGLAGGGVEIKFTGGITMGPLTLDFIGFEITSPVDSFDPHISLEGLGIDITKPPLTLEGTFMKGVVNVPIPTSIAIPPAATNLQVENSGTAILSQTSIDFTPSTPVTVGQSSTPVTITINNQSTTSNLNISSIEPTGHDFTISPLSGDTKIKPQSSGSTLTVTFAPRSKGFKQGVIVIKSDDPTAPEFEIILVGNKSATTPTGIKTTPVTAYNGSLSIGYKQYALSAVGSYAKLPDGAISTFLYGFLGAPMGGPPFFFVTGVAAGFGYNRAFTLPSAETINTFPLIQPVMSASSTMDFDSMNMLFMPTEGDFWGAVGVRAESFKMVESFILLDIQFKKELEIDIIGMSKMHFPKPPSDDPDAPALAKINIGLVARIIPEMGIVTVNGAFLPGSYVYNPLAHISGGFAMLSVFQDQTSGPWKDAQEGDFVVTLGGYASTYKPKSYYPQVPRLELNWQVNSNLSVKAQAYFAITPQAMMAGGDLVANFQIGGDLSIHVNFTVGADFIVYWKPYHYLATFYADLDVTASITLDLWLFTLHASISLDLGADLDIWGPSFSGNGTVFIHVLISFSVHVSFGDSVATPVPISWSEFSTGLLPEPDKMLTTNIANGLVASQSNAHYNVVNAKELEIYCSTKIPASASAIQINGASEGLPSCLDIGATFTLTPTTPSTSGLWVSSNENVVSMGTPNPTTGVIIITGATAGSTTLTYTASGQIEVFHVLVGIQEFGIKPMGKTATNLTGSTFNVSISNVDVPGSPTPANDKFNVEFILGNVPAAMWEPAQTSGTIPVNTTAHLIQNVITGAKITLLPPSTQNGLTATPPTWEPLIMAPTEEATEFTYSSSYAFKS